MGLTNFIETNALLDVMSEREEQALSRLRGLTLTELQELRFNATYLARLCFQIERELASANSEVVTP